MASSDDQVPAQFYCSRGDAIGGPFSSRVLKLMAADGRLLPTDLVWKHGGNKKVLARTIKGLFTPTVTSQPEPKHSTKQHASLKNAAEIDESRSSLAPSSPLVRITRIDDVFKRGLLSMFHGYQITAVFDDVLITGRTVRYPGLEEANCTSDGLRRFLETTSFRFEVPFTSINKAELHGSVRNSLFGPSLDPFATVTLRTAHRKHILYVPRRDSGILRGRLERLLGNQFETGVQSRGSFFRLLVLSTLWFFAFVFLNVTTLFLKMSEWMILANAVAAFVLIYAGNHVASRWSQKTFPIDILTAPVWPPPNAKPRVTQPFRSRGLGIAIKLVAITLLLAAIIYLPIKIQEYRIANPNDRQMRDMSVGLVVAILSLPSVIMLYLGHGLAQVGAKRANTQDRRKSILFLRSFALDGKSTLQPDTALAAVLGVSGSGSLKAWFSQVLTGMNLVYNLKFMQCVHPLRLLRLFFGIVADSTEQSIVRFFSGLGPVYAIGKPGERIAESGAFREYVADDQWQPTVLSHMENCQAVVLQPSQTEGMKWEIDTVLQRIPLERVLLVFAGGPGMADDYENLKSHLQSISTLRLPASLPFRGVPVFVWFERNGTVRFSEVSYASPTAWVFRGDAVDLNYTLQPFVQGIHGGEREEPRVVRSHAWYEYLSAWAIAAAWFVGFGIWITQGSTFQGYVAPYTASPSRSISGTAIPYSVEIPESWVPRLASEPPLEHEFAKTGVGLIRVVAHSGREDLSTLPETSAATTKANSGRAGKALLTDVIVEATQNRKIGDRECVEIRLRNELRNGDKEFQRIIAYSGGDGTFLINVIAAENIDQGQEAEIQRILQSVKFTKTFADEIKQRFLNAPDSQVQTIRGKSVLYTVRIPRSWEPIEPPDPIIEHMFRIPKGGVLVVIAHSEEEDLSTIAEQIRTQEATELGDKAQIAVERSEDINLNGMGFKRVKLLAEMADGTKVAVHCLAHSSKHGTLLLKGSVVETENTAEEQVILDEVLMSARISLPIDGRISVEKLLKDSLSPKE